MAKKTRRWNYGFGSVYLRKTKDGKDRWAIDYTGRGRRIREVVKDAQTRGEAVIALQNRVRESFDNQHRVVRGGNLSFSKLADIYIEDYAKVKKRSWRSDYYVLRSCVKPFFGQRACSDITALDIERLVKKRIDDGKTKSTANRCVQLLKTMFNLAVDWGYMADNPAAKVKLYSEKGNEKERVLTDEEQVRLLDACPPWMRPIILCAVHTGMRRGEVLSLRWDHVDFDKLTIRVDKTKSGKPRFIDIGATLLKLLLRQRVEHPKSEFVFPNDRTGKPFVGVWKAFHAALKAASITGCRFHDLRHTFASRLMESGADIITVRDLLGHHDVRITQRYTHSGNEQRRRAIESLDPASRSLLSRVWHAATEATQKPAANPYFSMN